MHTQDPPYGTHCRLNKEQQQAMERVRARASHTNARPLKRERERMHKTLAPAYSIAGFALEVELYEFLFY